MISKNLIRSLAILFIAVIEILHSARAGELNVVWMGWPEEYVAPLMKGFQSANPDVQLKIERIPFVQIMQTLEVRLSARESTPDIFMCDGSLTSSYAARGHALDLSSVIDRNRLTPSAASQASFDGKIYSAPFGSSSQQLYYNKDLFKAAGIEPPSADPSKRWTWEKVVEVARRLRDPKNNVYGLVIAQADRPFQLLPLGQSKGGVPISPDGLKATGYIDTKPFIDAFTFYQKMYNEWDIAPKGLFQINLNEELFRTGKAAMFIGGTFNMEEIAKYPKLNWGMGLHPYFEGGKPVTPTGAWHFCVNPRSKDLVSARKFVQYFMSEDVHSKWLQMRPYPPVLNQIWTKEKTYFDRNPGWALVRHELSNTAVPRPPIVGWREYEAILLQAIQDINNGVDVSKRLSVAAQLIDREMVKYK